MPTANVLLSMMPVALILTKIVKTSVKITMTAL